jgi:hypothetical protein
MSSTMTYGRQLAIMHGLVTTHDPTTIKSIWKSVQKVSKVVGVTVEAVVSQPNKVIDRICPPLSQSILAWTKLAPRDEIRGEEIDFRRVPSYEKLNIISHDAAQALMTSAALIWAEEVDLSKLGGRIDAVYQLLFLTDNGYSAPDVTLQNFKQVLKHYEIYEHTTDVAKIGPPIENELSTTMLNTPSWDSLKQVHGITHDLLFRACEEGIVSLDMLHGLLNAVTTDTSFRSVVRLARRDILFAASGTGIISGLLFATQLMKPSGDDSGASMLRYAPAILLAVLTVILLIFRGGYSATDRQKVIFLEKLERPFRKRNSE